MDRNASLASVEEARQPFAMVVIGGGATGAGIALEAASRGLTALLLERGDFGQGTSSRSTKIIHGGVRYLAQGRIGLVREALRERAYLLQNAPHLVAPQAFVVPIENAYERAKYFAGLKLYDLLSGKRRIEPCGWLSRDKFAESVDGVQHDRFSGAMRYFDAQFDDTRLLVNVLETATAMGASVLNYAAVVGLSKDRNGRLNAVAFRDLESGQTHEVAGKAIVNATGASSDELLKLDQRSHRNTILPSQGAHIVIKKEFLPGSDALLMPRTPDGRIMFAIPWLGHVLIGTTDTPVPEAIEDPTPYKEEIEMILAVAGNYLSREPKLDDILSAFAGIRPLVRAPSESDSSKVSREHRIDVLPSGLVSISGGKWTTYRLMAEQCVDAAASIHNLPAAVSRSANLRMLSAPAPETAPGRFKEYGKHASQLERLVSDAPELGEPLTADLPYTGAHCVWAVRAEMARTIEDVLARRTRALFLNARAALAAAPAVLEILTRELKINTDDGQRQLKSFENRVRLYGYGKT